MVAAIQHMTQRGFISVENRTWQLRVSVEEIDLSVPENLRQMIEAQIERLSVEEQRMLEVASVVGVTFSAALVAAAAQMDEIDVEDVCQRLCRRHLILRSAGSVLKRLRTGRAQDQMPATQLWQTSSTSTSSMCADAATSAAENETPTTLAISSMRCSSTLKRSICASIIWRRSSGTDGSISSTGAR